MSSLLEDLDVASLAMRSGLATHDQICTALHELGGSGGARSLLSILVERGFLDAEGRARVEEAMRSTGGGSPSTGSASESEDTTLARDEEPGARPRRLPSDLSAGAARVSADGGSWPDLGARSGRSIVLQLREERGLGGRVQLPGQGAFSHRSTGPHAFTTASFGRDYRYLFGREIGKGGSGVVTLVYDVDVGRRVALKTLRSGVGAGDREIERFIGEVQVTGQLEHPNIVPVHELGRLPNGEVYFTMKLVEGRTLETVIRGLRKGAPQYRRQYGRARLLHIFQQVCQGLAYAHSKGVVHRDLKPANIMLGEYGEVVVMDWGLAKLRGSAADGDGETPPHRIHTLRSTGAADTLHGTIKGTPAYMSPEQARGHVAAIDERSDVYSIGAILYECLTLKRPHEGVDPMAVIRAVARDPVTPPRQRAPEMAIPEDLDGIVMRCLEKDPSRRFPSASALQGELANYLEGTRRRRQAAQKVHEAASLAAAHSRLRQEVADLQRAWRERSRQVMPWDAPELKRPVWDLQREVTRREVEAIDTLGEAIVRYGQALAYDPENREARMGLASLYWRRFRDAEASRDPRDTRYFRKLVEQYDDGTYAERLAGDGTLEVASDPPGAAVSVWRYEERDGVRVPVDERRVGAAPLGPIPLSMGAHLLVLRLAGARETRVPVFLDRCERRRVEVALVGEDVVPDGFVYVPGGPFLRGGDPQAFDSAEREAVDVPSFALAKVPVTMAEYLSFVHDLTRDDPLIAQFRVPRSRAGTDAYFTRGPDGRYFIPGVDRRGDPVDPRFPVFGVSWSDAVAYCDWRSRLDGRRYRLPGDLEWEKAARGTDGRYYPWGDHFDASLCKTEESRRRRATPEPVGTFEGDVSPYGVRDMAGGVREWCADWFDAYRRLRLVRGGAWDLPRAWARACGRAGEAEEAVADNLGFRLAIDLGRGTNA